MVLRGSFLTERQKGSNNKLLQLFFKIVTLISFSGVPFPSLASERQKALGTRRASSVFNFDLRVVDNSSDRQHFHHYLSSAKKAVPMAAQSLRAGGGF